MKHLLFTLSLAIALASCKKGDDAPVITEDPLDTLDARYGPPFFNSSGYLYSLRTVSHALNQFDTVVTSGQYLAWFNDKNKTMDVGTLQCDGQLMGIGKPAGVSNVSWYVGGAPAGDVKNTHWILAANGSDFGGFDFVDTNAYPTLTYFSVPDTISDHGAMNIAFTPTTCDYVLVRLEGTAKQKLYRRTNGNPQTVSFSFSDLYPLVHNDTLDKGLTLFVTPCRFFYHGTNKPLSVVKQSVHKFNVGIRKLYN